MRPLGAAALASFCIAAAAPAAAAETHAIDLPAGRLGEAVAALGRQARIGIGISDPSLAAERVPAVRGRMTAEQALERLLRGLDARVVAVDQATFRIVRRPPAPATVRRPAPPSPRPLRAAAALPRSPPPRSADPEIIVTASRWAVPLRNFPGSAIIVDGEDPAFRTGPRGTSALVERVPALTSTHLGPGRNKLFVRGISESSFNGPTQATVGQYLGEARLNYNAPDPDLRLHDISRIEVLAGPQGTLYGAGSLGGIVRIVPNAPRVDEVAAELALGASATAHGDPGGDVAGVVNLPLAEGRLALRAGGYAISEGGYIDDARRGREDVNRVRVGGGRLAIRSLPDDHWTLDLGLAAQRIRGEDAQYAERNQPRLTRRSAIAQPFANDYLLVGGVAVRTWDDYRFVASGTLVRQKLEERYDATRDGNPPAAYDLTTEVGLAAAELRLSRRDVEGSGGWVVGASLLSNSSEQSREVDLFEAPATLRNRVENDIVEGAVYGEAAVPLTKALTATVGGRLNKSRLESSGFAFRPGFPLPSRPREAARTTTRFLPTAALAARLARRLLVYARYQESFRPGGLAIFRDDFNRFDSDRVRAVEAGLRWGAPGVGRFDAAAAVAYTRWTDIQADTIDNFGEPTTANVGNARIYTLDLSAGWRPLPGLALEASAVFNDSKVALTLPGILASVSPPLPGVARFSGRLAGHYSIAAGHGIDLGFSAWARYTGRSNLGAGDFLRRPQGDWVDVGLLARADTGRHSITLSVANLFDTSASRFALGTPFTLDQRDFTTPVRPRTVRLGWELRF